MEYQQLATPDGHQDGFKSSSHFSGISAPRQRIHWKAPTVMLSSLLLGFAFILGHHFFYQSLHHTPTGDAVFEQQINTGIGTAFAFIVRMFLIIAVGTAYWQLFWHQVKARPTTVAQLDTMSSIIGSALEFLSMRTLFRFPLMTSMAVIIWLIPLAVVFPPASLTVELSPLPLIASEDMRIGVPDFNKNEFAQLNGNGNNGASWNLFNGPRYKLSKAASAVASRGELLSFLAPSPNSSYELTFMAPALQCATVEGSMRNQWISNISKALDCSLEARYGTDKNGCHTQSLFLAWAPGVGTNVTVDTNNTIGALLQQRNDTAASLYIASQPTIDNSQPWNFVNCSLYNASYHLAVNYTGGVQNVKVSRNITHSVGYFPTLDQWGAATTNGLDPITGESAYLFSTLNQFGYQAIMDAFGRLLAGHITVDFRYAIGIFDFATIGTSVMTTGLTNTIELSNISQIAETCNTGGGTSVCNLKATNQRLNITGAPPGALSLPEAAEQLFENITLSLFSNDDFLTEAANSPTIKVTFHSPQNRYVYTWWRLAAPYIAALALSILATVIGAWAMLANGMTYGQHFSTILRTTKNADLQGATLGAADTTGADPLPGHVAKAKIDFRMQNNAIGLRERPKTSRDGSDFTYG